MTPNPVGTYFAPTDRTPPFTLTNFTYHLVITAGAPSPAPEAGQGFLTEEGSEDVVAGNTLVVIQKGTPLTNVDITGKKYPDPTDISRDRIISVALGGGGMPCPDPSCVYYRVS